MGACAVFYGTACIPSQEREGGLEDPNLLLTPEEKAGLIGGAETPEGVRGAPCNHNPGEPARATYPQPPEAMILVGASNSPAGNGRRNSVNKIATVASVSCQKAP